MAIKTDTFTGGGGGGGAVDSVNGDTGAVIVTLDGVTDQGASTTNSITVGGVTIGTEYSLPTTDGTSGQALTTNGTGTLSFSTITSDVTSVNTQTGAVTLSANDLAADHTASNYTAANANIDGHLSGIDSKLGTLTAGLTYQGSYNANTNSPSLANAEQGDLYIVSVAGTQFGETWSVGDHLLVNADMGGVIDNSKIDKIDNTDQVTSVNTQTGAVVLSGDDIAADHTAVNYTAANANIDGHLSGIDSKLASQLESGDNISLLNNNSGFISDITGESLNDLSDVSFTAGAGIDNYVLTYDNGTSSWGAEIVPSAPVTSVNTLTGAVVVSGDDIAADHTAVNYTAANANVDGHLSGVDTKLGTLLSDITGESLNDLSDVSFTAGAGIDNYVLTYDNGTSSWGAEAAPTAASASETVAGVIEIATNAEATAATATDKALVPSNISSLDLSAMDNTTSAFISGITSESLNDLSDVNFTAGAGIDNYVLTYDNGTSSWGAEAAPGSTPASETVAGIIEIATNAEAAAGTATDKALVPSNIASLDLSAMDNTTSGFISDVVSDTTPQLGGSLDVNGNAITSASNGLVEITPNGTGAVKLGGNTNPAELRFFDEAGTNYVALKAPLDASISADVTFTLPATDGTNGQALTTNGLGVLSFTTISGGGGSAPDVTLASPSANYTISTSTNNEEVYILTPSANIEVALPAASTCGEGYKYQIKNMSASYSLTINPNSTETVDGQSTIIIGSQYESLTLVTDSSNWFVI